MRAILLLLTTLVFAVVIFCAGMAVTAYLIAEPEPHRFAHLDTPDLWTSEPVVIDPSRQSYERIAAAPAIASLPAVESTKQDVAARSGDDGNAIDQGADNGSVDGMQTAALLRDDMPPAAVTDPAHAEWCYDRYRSYTPEDNSYQPYGGGPRQQCQSPWTPMAEDAQANASGDAYNQKMGVEAGSVTYATGQGQQSAARVPAEHASSAPVGAHEEWCYARYRSYRVDDNSYQPFEGGPRRVCSSPYG
ncbi:BA14K-like protein [Rhizobium sp. NFR07]|uniref:BA14K family protein n=1 Tax=Rhizobium sp. NFR07 TaxID=1566262 RepID=UPI0008E3700B|nr:BA14K family protein [Rhizobium sp. NFR07]SFB43595.1 BA14K-like protein [Rhizobium sp. NFR07]